MKRFFKFLTKKDAPKTDHEHKDSQFEVVRFQTESKSDRKPDPSLQNSEKSPSEPIEEFDLVLEEVDSETGQIDEEEDERRKFQRLQREAVLDKEILIYTNNLNTSVNSRDKLLDLSAGGLLLLSSILKEIDDVLILEFRIGTMQFKLKGKVKRRKERVYGLEFVNPPEETIDSIEQLYGCARLNRPRRGMHKTNS